MQPTRSCRFLLLMFLSAVSMLPSLTSATQKSHRTSVRFLARGTAIYSSFSGSQSEYLVELRTSNQALFPARLLYRRALQSPDIPDELIDSGRPVYLRLTRATDCDQNYETLSTLWLSGTDGRLWAQDGLLFVHGIANLTIAANEVLPCYFIAPHEIRLKRRYPRAE